MSHEAELILLARNVLGAARALAESGGLDALEEEHVLETAQLDRFRATLASDQVLGDGFRRLLSQSLADAEHALADETRTAVISHDTGRGGDDNWAYEEVSELTPRGHRIVVGVRHLQALEASLAELNDASLARRLMSQVVQRN